MELVYLIIVLCLLMSLSYDLDPQLPDQIQGDPYWLKQILLNLVNNAINFTDQGGVYVYFARVETDHWSVEVRDTGSGIPPEAQNRIFEAFEQGEDTN